MKKVLSLVLAVVLVLGMSAVAFGKLTETQLEDFDATKLGFSGVPTAKDRDGYWRPDDTIELEIWYDKDTADARPLSRADVRALKLDARVRATEGSAIIDSYKIDYRKTGAVGSQEQDAYLKINLVEDWVSTKEQDFNVIAYLTLDKSRLRDSETEVTGVFANESTVVYEDEDYVYLGDVPVVEADDYIRDIKVDLGQGFTIRAKMFDGKKYYGKVSQEIKPEDEAILAQYPSIETVYYVSTIGLASTGEVVQFEDLAINYYAYAQDEDGNLVYIGRTNDKLAYYTKYFLSSKELDVDVVVDGDDILVPGDDVEEPPAMGGDGEAPANVNDNPSTGR